MAELDEKLLKTLDQTLQNMNTHLQNLESTLRGVKGGIDATFNPAIIKSFSDEIRGLKAARIIDADKSVAEVNKVYTAIQELSYMVKTGMKLEPVSLEQLDQYKKRLEEIDKLLEPLAGKRGLKTDEYLQRSSLYRERDRLRDILDSENPVVPVPLKKEEIAAAVEMLKRYEEVYKNIRKGDQQRAVEIANIAAKERAADMQTAEAAVSQREQAERRKAEIARAWAEQEAREKAQREKMKTASEKAAADERTAIAEAEAKKKSEIAKAWAEQDRRRYEKDGDPLGEIAARKGLTGTLAALEDQTAVNEWRKQTAEEQKRIAKEEAEVEKQIKKEMAEEEKKLAAEEKQRYQDAVAANKAMTKAEDDLAEAKRKARTAESKAAYTEDTKQRIEEERKAARERAQQAKEAAAIQKKADAESMANQRRQIQIKSQLAAIDKNRISITKQSSDREKALAAQQQSDYRSLQSELSKLIARQKELNAVSQGSGRRAKDRLSTYTISESEKAMRRYADAVRNAHREQKKLGDETNKMLPTIQRLASAFGVAFSVRGLAQFGKKLIETRGEFEMQFVAMKQIIGDVDAATKIWNQTMQQALQSPFKAMQLVTYTKQLAAYRIETEKLFDTTKRLADISAGLGVDMGRLILAYGQVKSANFLRASEVRQFTEAGVNIVGNLAKYFTELEGRAVGTSEVMERITKRMVLFSDVEAIFKRMTDEGGEFFNMQEVQADTVKGQIQKLHDAYDQMLNTIGQANQGAIRNFVDTLNNLVRNWQDVAFVLKANINWITIFGASLYALSNKYTKGATTQTLWFSKALTGNEGVLLKEVGAVRLFGNEVGLLSVKQRIGVIAMRSFQGAVMAVGKALSMLWPLLVFEGITLLVERLTRANRELKRFREELQEVASTNVGQMDEEINGYDSLIAKLKQTTEGTMARKEVLDEISRRYGKYLDFIVTEKTSIEDLAGAYDKVVSSIRNYTAEKIREEQQQRLEKGLYDEYQDLIKNLTGASVQFEGGWVNLSKSQAKNIAKLVEKSLKETGAVDLQSILEKYLGLDFDDASYERINYFVEGVVNSYVKAYKGLSGELQEIRDDIEGTTPVFASEAEYEQYKKNYEEANKKIAEQNKQHEAEVDLVKQKTEEQWKIDDEIAKLRLENEEKILGIRKEYGLISEGQYNDELARLHGQLDTYETDYNERLAKAMAESYGDTWQTTNKEARDMYNYVVSTEQALAQGTTQRNKQLKESYKGFKESLEQYNAQYQAAVNSGASKGALDKIQSDIDFATLMMKAIELAAQLRGIDLSEKKTTTRTTHENASKLISLIKEMRGEYDKLSKSAYGYAKSEEKVRESYKDSVKEILGKAGITDYDFTTNEGMIQALEKVKTYATRLGKDAAAEVQKYIDQLETEIEINAQVRIREDFGKQMEKAFGDYELTVELGKLNMPKGVAEDMFGIEETDLQKLREDLSRMYNGLRDENGQLSDEAFKDYEKFLNKIDDLERKQQRERLKDYAKYLEAQYSDRVKLEMDYVRRLAQLEAETAIPEQQKSDIRKGLEREFLEKSRKQDWEDFKGSEFYVSMMEDLEKQGSASLEVMRKKLLEMRENAENLSPRALKEVVNALEKIDELEKKRIPPLQRIREEQEKLRGIEIKDVYEKLALNQQELAQEEEKQRELERMIMLEEERQKLEQQGLTLEEAKARLARSEQALSLILPSLGLRSDGSKEGEERRRILTETVNQAKKEVEKWQEIVRMLSGQTTIDRQEAGSEYRGLSLSELKSRREDAKNRIKDLEGIIGKDEELVKAQKDLEDAWNDTWEAAKRWAQSINGIFDGVMDTIGYFSDSTSTLTAEWKEFGDTSISALTDLVSGIQAYQQANAAAQKAGLATGLFTANGLQLAMVVLGVIIKVVQAIAKLHDARIDKEIEQSKERVDDLQKAYERLEKQIEKTFDTVSYMREFNKETQNLYEQIEEANRQIAAAQDYKSEDKRKEVIDAAEDAKQQALDALEEIKQAQIEVFGGIGENNYRSAAEGFVDAWKSAFFETGDGLQGLQDHFDEFLQDWFVKQGTLQAVSRYYSKVFDYINDVVDGGNLPTQAQIEQARALADEAAYYSDEYLKALTGIFGFNGEGSLSGLAAGIQGMTGEQANILEAYWNSVRGYTASIDMNVARIVDLMTVGGGGVDTNPQLQQLELIAHNTNSINTLLQSVTRSGHGLGGSGIKVFVE